MPALEVGMNGLIVACSDYLLKLTGWQRHDLVGAPVRVVLDSETDRRIQTWLAQHSPAAHAADEVVGLRSISGAEIVVCARLCTVERAGLPVLFLAGLETGASVNLIHDLREKATVLQEFLDASTEAIWCIEFTEPVDLSQNEMEIIRQVFINECHWSMCNKAMARFYDIPPDVRMDDIPVSTIFQRNAMNETFIRNLIQNNFNIDRILTIDIKLNGSAKYVENNVRSHIENNFLHRLWGTVHDVTDFKEQQQHLAYSEAVIRNVLTALPDGVLIVNRKRVIKALNPAAQQLLGLTSESILEQDFTEFLPFPQPELSRIWANGETHRWTSELQHHSGIVSPCDVRVAQLDSEEESQFVLALRPVAAKYRGRVARPSIKVSK